MCIRDSLNDMEDKKVANQQIKKIQCKEAKSYFEKEEYDKAIAIYHKWGEKEEERKVIQQKALMLLYENKFTEAIKLYEQIKDCLLYTSQITTGHVKLKN